MTDLTPLATVVTDSPDYREPSATTRKAIEDALANGTKLPDGVVIDYTTGATVIREVKPGKDK